MGLVKIYRYVFIPDTLKCTKNVKNAFIWDDKLYFHPVRLYQLYRYSPSKIIFFEKLLDVNLWIIYISTNIQYEICKKIDKIINL